MQLPAINIAQIIGAKNIGDLAHSAIIKTLLTDSRDLIFPDSTMFFALRTAGNDGHNFINPLYQSGVRFFVIDRAPDEMDSMPEASFLLVDNVLDALQTLAAHIRRSLSMPVIGITGSRGKTIVKEQLNKILTAIGYRVARSPRSYNSQIGVPLSIWDINPDSDVAIIEAGISETGEMQRLQNIILPDIGIFTALTDEHDDGFANTDTKAAEKAQLFTHCPKVFISADADCAPVADIIENTCPDAKITRVKGDNKDLSLAVAQYFTSIIPSPQSASTLIDDTLMQSVPDIVSSRINVTETLKNCLIVYDGFTFDSRSLIDGLNFATRHLTPGRSLTVIIPSLPDDPDIPSILAAKGVKRLITVQQKASLPGSNIKVEYRDYSIPSQRLSISDFSNEVIFLKGEAGTMIEDIKSALEAPRHETVMEIDLGAITANFNFFRSKVRPSTGIVAMVKAAGYGIGALELAKTLQNQGAAYLAVAVIDEGVELRRAGISMPIIVMNPIGTNYNALFESHIEPSVFSMRELRLLLDNAIRLGQHDYPVHIKLDTGMHRLGFLKEELPELIHTLNSQHHLKVASVFSHLATADCLDQDEYTMSQLRNFDLMSNTIIEALPYRAKRHVLNTAGILRYPEYQYDMVRLGIGLYGVSPIDGYKLQTVARLTTTIISIKEWDEGITIGYGRKGKVTKKSVIATIPIGYADGLNRHLSNGAASVLVNGMMCPIIGNICMDQCMIDVTDANASIGDTVEIFGSEAPVERLSDALDTIPYEILTSISPRVKRIYFRD